MPSSALEPVVPGARQIGHRQRSGHQRLLQAEAQDDMRRIGHLIGIDADEAALDAPPQPRQVVRPIGRGIAAECRRAARARASVRKASERQACISTISDWLSCAAMPAASPTGWRAQARGQAALVQRVAGLVHHGEHRLGEVGLVVACGDAHVGRACRRRTDAPNGPAARGRSPGPDARTGAGTAPPAPRPGTGPRAAAAAGCAPGAPRPAAARGAGTPRSRRTPGRRRPRACRAGSRPSARRTGSRPSAGASAAAASRVSRTTSSRCGRTMAKSDWRRASRHTFSQAELARACASTRSGGIAVARV